MLLKFDSSIFAKKEISKLKNQSSCGEEKTLNHALKKFLQIFLQKKLFLLFQNK